MSKSKNIYLVRIPLEEEYSESGFSSGTDTRDREILDEINQQHKEAWKVLRDK